ncbi:hypothetical protein ACLOJK_003744 [Asimina triloba]
MRCRYAFWKVQRLCSRDGDSALTIGAEEPAEFAQEEFVETQYYSELNSIDKQHHSTGSGFIRATETSGDQFDIRLEGHESLVGEAMGGCFLLKQAKQERELKKSADEETLGRPLR